MKISKQLEITRNRVKKYPIAYEKSLELQDYLECFGIAWHNTFSDECNSDFSCCCGTSLGNPIHTYLPSYYTVLKQHNEDVLDQIARIVNPNSEVFKGIRKIMEDEIKDLI